MTTTNLQQKTVLEPEIYDALRTLKLDIFRSLNCIKVGQIQSFDPAKKTATVQILLKRVLPDGSTPPYQVLTDCPVFTLQGGGGALQFPVSSGDDCLLLFSDRNLDAWFETGNAMPPYSSRAHDLSDGICLVGLNSLQSSLANYPTEETTWFLDGSFISQKDGFITMGNEVTTLLELLQNLITVLQGITTTGGDTVSAASQSALAAASLLFQELLY